MLNLIKNIRLVAFDFDGVFTDNMVYVLEDGSEAVRCSRSDGIGLQKLKKLKIETAIISTEPNPVVSARARKLDIECFQDCHDKRAVLDEIAERLDISWQKWLLWEMMSMTCPACLVWHFRLWCKTHTRM